MADFEHGKGAAWRAICCIMEDCWKRRGCTPSHWIFMKVHFLGVIYHGCGLRFAISSSQNFLTRVRMALSILIPWPRLRVTCSMGELSQLHNSSPTERGWRMLDNHTEDGAKDWQPWWRAIDDHSVYIYIYIKIYYTLSHYIIIYKYIITYK
jgi:hypothetical protein